VPLDAVSSYLIRATIATEDPDFLTNNGVNQRGLIRAACENVHLCSSSSTLTTGGSGITQQLVKLLFETPEEAAKRSVDRKLKEAALAVELTKRYNKDQILEWYLNTIYYANRANGIGAAAKIYFGAKASDLDLAQASNPGRNPRISRRLRPGCALLNCQRAPGPGVKADGSTRTGHAGGGRTGPR